jgi:hypothetical protein
MRFIRQLCVKHHRSGDHYSLAIPAVVAEAIGLHEAGGLISIECDSDKCYHNARLQAYRDSAIPWRQAFNPSVWRDPAADLFRPVPVPPNVLGRSRPTGCGEVMDLKARLRDSRDILRLVKLRVFPHGFKRGPKRRRRWY